MATETKVVKLPDCDFADNGFGECIGEERYDFRTRGGMWAFGCRGHWEALRATPHLGTGYGQKLVVETPTGLPQW